MFEIEIPGVGLVPLPEIEAETAEDGTGYEVLDLLAFLVGDPLRGGSPSTVSLTLAIQVETGSRLMPDRVRALRLLYARLWPLLGTEASQAVEYSRALLALDWACRWACPRALRQAGLLDEAPKIDVLEPITGLFPALAALRVLTILTQRLREGFPRETRRVLANAIRACRTTARGLQAVTEGSLLAAAKTSADVAFYVGASNPVVVWSSWAQLLDAQIELSLHAERRVDLDRIGELRQAL